MIETKSKIRRESPPMTTSGISTITYEEQSRKELLAKLGR